MNSMKYIETFLYYSLILSIALLIVFKGDLTIIWFFKTIERVNKFRVSGDSMLSM